MKNTDIINEIYTNKSKLINTIRKFNIDADTCEDIFQDTIVKFIQLEREFNNLGYFSTMLSHNAINYTRGRKEFTTEDYVLTDLVESETTPTINNDNLLETIKSVCTEREVMIIELHIFNGMKFNEIEKTTNISSSTLRSIYNRSLKKIESVSKIEDFINHENAC